VLLGTALALGALHTFEADHLAAVSAFVVRRPRPVQAMGYGLHWALGHGGTILVAGTVLVLTRLHLPEAAGDLMERIVGVSLIGLGAWVFLSARRLHAHAHTHADGRTHSHLHAHRRDRAHPAGPTTAGHSAEVPHDHEHPHAATAMGALHGLAGTGAAVALLPIAAVDGPGPALLFLLAFGLGTAACMALYALSAGWLAGRAAHRSGALGRTLARVAGLGSVAVGVLWLVG
jgi:cytochrome c biogenesis protein CcdA